MLAAIGAAGIVTSMDGACAALTAIPPPVMLLTGLIAVFCAFSDARARRDVAATCAHVLCGCALGLLLPTSPPPLAGAVVTRAAGGAVHGDIFDLLDRLDSDPSAVLGRSAVVSGQWASATRDGPATVSRRVMSCCAADAIAVGFDVEPKGARGATPGTWVHVSGIVRERFRNGEARFVLEQSTVTRLEDSHLQTH
jgi:uncharacterized protein DUF1980